MMRLLVKRILNRKVDGGDKKEAPQDGASGRIHQKKQRTPNRSGINQSRLAKMKPTASIFQYTQTIA